MKNKSYVYSLILIGLMVLLTGCSNPVQEDIIDYYNNGVGPLVGLETEAIEAYDSATGENYTDDQHLYEKLDQVVIPKYGRFIEELEVVRPETEEVQNLHEIYIEAANTQYNAFLQMQLAIENQDESIIIEVNEKLDGARRLIRDWQYQLDKLSKENNVVLE